MNDLATEPKPARAADADAAAARIDGILDRLGTDLGPQAAEAAEELVRSLMAFYGAGLARVLDVLTALGAAGAPATAALLADQQVAALLALHDLNPEDLPTRVGRALDALPGRPYRLVRLDEAAGTAVVRSRTAEKAAGGGCGCGSTRTASRAELDGALACFAPELTAVEAEPERRAAPLLQIGRRSGTGVGVGAPVGAGLGEKVAAAVGEKIGAAVGAPVGAEAGR